MDCCHNLGIRQPDSSHVIEFRHVNGQLKTTAHTLVLESDGESIKGTISRMKNSVETDECFVKLFQLKLLTDFSRCPNAVPCVSLQQSRDRE